MHPIRQVHLIWWVTASCAWQSTTEDHRRRPRMGLSR
uniref:Uncharacterized protein n=1 Tax=Arundo donax TaxID=35708 RepID=A0A0A9A1D7_ARUDO